MAEYAIAYHGELCLTEKQRTVLAMALNPDRVASRAGDRGKSLSYLEAWDVKAHLIRVFGYTGFDAELIEYRREFEREYVRIDYEGTGSNKTEKGRTQMVEVVFSARVALTVKCEHGVPIATYIEAAAGQANVTQANASRGDAYDNALKQAESDALKRCAINLGTQFGLSLYDKGNTSDVVRGTLLDMAREDTPEHQEALSTSLGVKVESSGEATNEGAIDSDHPDAVAGADQAEGVR